MTFLDPVNLTLLGLATLIVLAYLLRMPRRRLRVPDALVAKLALAETSRINRQRRTLVSLVIQIVILLLLVLSAALPYLGDAREGDRSMIVLLDVSASMQTDDAATLRVLSPNEDAPTPAPSRTRFEKALDAARGLARGMRRGDRIMLMTVGKTVNVALNFEGDREVVLRALDAVTPSAEEADFAEASRLAAAMAHARDDVEVVLITDGAVRPEHLAPLAERDDIKVRLVRVGEACDNLGIATFRVRRNLDSPTDYEALVAVCNASDEPRTIEVELLLDDEVFDIASVTVPARGETVQVFREKLRVGGILKARLRVVDALAADNVAWEVLKPPRRLRVLLVSDDTREASFLVRAVGSNAGAVEGMVLTRKQYETAIAPDPSVLARQRDAVIFDRWVPEDPAQLPPTHLMTIDCVPPGMPVSAGEPFDKPLIRKWERGHPLMSYLNLRNVFITSARRVDVDEPRAGQPPVERVAEMVTSPLVLAWEREMPNGRAGGNDTGRVRARPQRFVVIAFDPRESDIVLRKELPLLLWNSFLWFQKGAEPATQVAPGETIALDASAAPEVDTVTVVTPAGDAETVPVDADTGNAFFAATSAAGVYTCRIGKTEDAFVVNAGGRFESDLRAADDLATGAEALEADALARVFPGGRELWPYLLFVAGLLLAAEAIVFHRRICF